MTKAVKNRILYQLNFFKSIGYEYHNNVEFGNNEINNSNLPNNLTELKTIVENCYLCDLCKSRKNVLFGQGNSDAKILFILDEPSASEDELGQFFVGKSGEILKNMIQNVLMLDIDDVYITNIVKCKSNDSFNATHANNCRVYLDKQIEIVNPMLIVTFGEKVYKYLTNDNALFEQLRGNILPYKYYNVLPTFSPNILLRNPSLKKEAYYDMLKIKSILEIH
ncbi:uracil-DNA glycosylase, family 4 [Malaciobacter marinus]|uniref:Type-4 uracil-DNA glycosylase n=1 Tax=Malaciobacter marinus TaxID=505249 RepID=A0A347TJC8_9BACT|nr:uracil-DNA glycosylase [Malaciobacter marinus]AXX86706.1 uracil-DNA glycosylase, family 4 [Malaciobacter marinus]PHO14751.1 uracil-DNA glycosylase [Malaciobacter marinus]